ncbi:MAG: Zn-dependent M16 (insulinase) family peptidase [Granulosicoccus sp.]|jgi:Zn-dependent M16 (insulinase) family peptidase
MPHTAHPKFTLLRSKTIDSLDITISEYQHQATGAQHVHISADNSENVFLVALRTVPHDSTGVAHILEHTALCGSEKYPVRDPFFMMIRRSLNTFMNAMTSSDWTAYPFASQNRKDFDNLLGVYLDAVFFSRLDPLDFAQEGHRVEFTEAENSDSPLVYKGVVYNEMKGAMSSVSSQLWQQLSKHVFTTNTYHYNSGGEPKDIPTLSYDQLKSFYQTHYHPSNAIFMTFGDISAATHQEKFEQLALSRFEKLDEVISVPAETRFSQPKRVTEHYAYTPSEGDDPDQQSHVVMAWLLDKSTDLKRNLEVHLLSSLLFDNSASPLQHLLETSPYGESPSPLCGSDDSQYEMLFVCGLQGCKSDDVDAIETSVITLLVGLSTDGMPQEHIEASLHQLELQQREIGGDGYPYGLQLIMSALSPATHRGDILNFMDLESALVSLREDIQDRSYLPSLIKRLFIDNTHRVTLTLAPDDTLQAAENDAEIAELATKKAALSEDDKQAIIDQALALEARQQQEENIDLLPQVTLDDIPAATPFPKGDMFTASNLSQPVTHYTAGTNGLSYQQIIFHLPALSQEEWLALPYYNLCLTEMGIGSDDYLQVQQRQSQVVGSIGSYYSLRNHTDDTDQYYAYVTLSAKALSTNQQAMSELMLDTLQGVDFTDEDRIKDLIAQAKAGREQSITGNGHSYAMQAAAASFNPMSAAVQQLMGLTSIQEIKQRHTDLQAGHCSEFVALLQSIHQKILTSQKQVLLVAEEQSVSAQVEAFASCLAPVLSMSDKTSSLSLPTASHQVINQAWITQSQVHFCAKAYPTVTMNHPDAPVLCVLGGVLRNGFLHRTVREQGGAYGGGASQDNNSASFRFYSYRDPRFADTLNDFDAAIDWLLEKNISDQQIEEAVLGVIGSLDKPGSPAGEAKQAFHARLVGRDDEKRNVFRQRVIDVSVDDLYRVTTLYLQAEKANTAVVTGKHGIDEAKQLGLDLIYV